MSFLFKPTGGAGITGTAVDPLGPSGVLIDPLTELTQPGGLSSGDVLQADGAGGYFFGAQTASADIRLPLPFVHTLGVPGAGGVRYLQFAGGAVASLGGFHLPADGRLRAITVLVDDATDTNTYDIEVLKDPAGRLGAPVVLRALALPATTLFVVNRTFTDAVLSTEELGVRITRTSGSGDSTFKTINVITEWSTP